MILVKYLFQILETVDESHSARVLIGCKPIRSYHVMIARQFFANILPGLTGDTRKIFVSNIKTVDESHSARVLIGCKPIILHVFFKIF